MPGCLKVGLSPGNVRTSNAPRLPSLPTVPGMVTVLLVEDDARIRSAVLRALADRGLVVDHVATGMGALQRISEEAPDVVVLDLGLPDVDGRQVLRMIRSVSEVPVIVATARDDEQELVATLNDGADDYVIKPYSGAQLAARIRAVWRRAGGDDQPTLLRIAELEVDLPGRVARVDGEELDLSRLEFDLLAHLAEHVGEVVSKQELLAEVWRQPMGGADKTVDVHLSWLRRKLGETAAEPRFLQTVRGVGVKLVDPT